MLLTYLLTYLQRDGSLRRVHQPVNPSDPYKSLLRPLYNYDIDRVMKARARQQTGRPSRLSTVPDTDED